MIYMCVRACAYMCVLTGEQGAVVWLGCLLLVFKAVNPFAFRADFFGWCLVVVGVCVWGGCKECELLAYTGPAG
jgi:hypothetical protein